MNHFWCKGALTFCACILNPKGLQIEPHFVIHIWDDAPLYILLDKNQQFRTVIVEFRGIIKFRSCLAFGREISFEIPSSCNLTIVSETFARFE